LIPAQIKGSALKRSAILSMPLISPSLLLEFCPEGRSWQTFPIEQISLFRIVGTTVSDSCGLWDIFVPNFYCITFDNSVRPFESAVIACDRKVAEFIPIRCY